jgi:hypothetical protein
MFASAGFFVGEDHELLPATEANPTGHWERLGVWRANEQILEKLEASWFDPPPVAAQLAARDWALPLLHDQIDQLIEGSQGLPVALKDPRINVMMPLWGPIVRTMFHPVLVIRDPVEIALSLQRRDGTPIVFALAAWELHMTSLLKEMSGRTVTIAHYASLVDDENLARSTVRAAVAGIDQSRAAFVRPEHAGEAFDRRLYRHRASPADHHRHLTGRQVELWRFLSLLPSDNQPITAPQELTEPTKAALAGVRLESQRIASAMEQQGQDPNAAEHKSSDDQLTLLADTHLRNQSPEP